MRRMHNCFVKWLTTRNIVSTSYYLRKKFYPWNVLLIVFLLCLGVNLTCTSVRLYCEAYLRMLTRWLYGKNSAVLLHYINYNSAMLFFLFFLSMAFDCCSLNDYLLTYLVVLAIFCTWVISPALLSLNFSNSFTRLNQYTVLFVKGQKSTSHNSWFNTIHVFRNPGFILLTS